MNPDQVCDALQDRIHHDTGNARAAKSVKVSLKPGFKLCRAGCSPDPQPLSNFQRRGNSEDGYDTICRECRNRQTRLARTYAYWGES